MDKLIQIRNKKRIHIGMLIFLILFHLVHLVIYEMVKTGMWPLGEMAVKASLGFVALGLSLLAILFLKYFIKSKALFIGYIILFFICIIFQMSALSLNIRQDINTLPHTLLVWSVIISVIIFFSILYVSIRDIFTEKHDLSYALLGAANIFLSIIVTFSFIISIFALCNPSLMPYATTVNDINNASFVMGSYSVAGIDLPYDHVPQILKNITTFESIIMHLYAVMIVGRLLSN